MLKIAHIVLIYLLTHLFLNEKRMKSTIQKTLFLSILCTGCIDSSIESSNENLNDFYTCESASDIQKNMVKFVNKARSISRSCGTESFQPAPAVIWNEKLQAAAEKHARDMANNDFFSHTGSDGSKIGERATAEDYNWITVGENIFGGVETSLQAVEGWLESPGHCENIMNPDFKEMGVVCIKNSETTYGTYWVQVFGTSYHVFEEINPDLQP
jgi:uncharacterized protein YkwD